MSNKLLKKIDDISRSFIRKFPMQLVWYINSNAGGSDIVYAVGTAATRSFYFFFLRLDWLMGARQRQKLLL